MPHFQVHCDECEQKLGAPFPEVHQWMDELHKDYGARHRRFRHTLEGIEEVRKQWGDLAADAARLHLLADLKEEGWVEGRDPVPKNTADYVRMGLF